LIEANTLNNGRTGDITESIREVTVVEDFVTPMQLGVGLLYYGYANYVPIVASGV
jgi:hypothetical protein